MSSGKISSCLGISFISSAVSSSVSPSFLINFSFGLMVLLYVVVNIFYSIFLKHVVILDVMIIAAGYVLRVLAGAELVDAYP